MSKVFNYGIANYLESPQLMDCFVKEEFKKVSPYCKLKKKKPVIRKMSKKISVMENNITSHLIPKICKKIMKVM